MSAAAANPDSSIRWSERLLSQGPRGTRRSQAAPETAQPDRHELAQMLENTPLTTAEGGVVHRLDRRMQRMLDKSQAGVKRIAGPADLMTVMIIRLPSAVVVGAFE
jgi:hypothetical protein